MHKRFSIILSIMILAGLLTSPVHANSGGEDNSGDRKITDQEVDLYKKEFPASLFFGKKFSDFDDPDQAVREEIYLDRHFARLGLEAGVMEDEDFASFINAYENERLMNYWLNQSLDTREVSLEEVGAFYDENPEYFTNPETVTFRHIFFLVPEGDEKAEAEYEKLGKSIVARAKRGMDFERLTVEYSQTPNVDKAKGVIGPVDLERLQPVLANALRAMEPGEISGPIRTKFGWEILKLDELKPASSVPMTDVIPEIEAAILNRELGPKREQLVEKTRARYKHTVNEELLEGSGELPLDETFVTVEDHAYTLGEVLDAINSTHSYEGIKDDRERIQTALPRFLLTEKVRLEAQRKGWFQSGSLRMKMEMIHDRLVGEKYYRDYESDRKPTEEEIHAYYEEHKENFRTPPQGKGTIYWWEIKDYGALSEPEKNYHKTVLYNQIEDFIKKINDGEMDRDDLKEKADEATEKDWFRPGPSGYSFDMAFFNAEPGSFSDPFMMKGGLAIAWVEDIKEGELKSIEETRESLEKLVQIVIDREEKTKLRDEVLEHYRSLEE